MKTSRWFVLLVVGWLLAGCSHYRPAPVEKVDVEIHHLLGAIDQASKVAYAKLGDDFDLELSGLSVTFETVTSRTTSGELYVAVASVDASREKDATQTVTVSLAPPKKDSKAGATTDPDALTHPGMVEGLVRGIQAAALAAQGASEGVVAVHADDLPLEANKVAVSITFALTWSASGTPAIEIFGIEIYGGKSRGREIVHSITMDFTIPSSDSSS